nr:MAG TPA: hypothetical protein [Caudoviricetes sp.]
MKTQIETKKDTYTIDYPQAVQAAQEQTKIIWFAEELGVEKDENDIRTKCTEGERHGITTVLKLFTQYELMLGGEEFWGAKVTKMFPRPEIERMAATFSFVELGIHAPFYDLINKTLGIATDEFYSSWQQDEVMRDRVAFIEKYAQSEDALEATAAFAFMEGVVLFSNFAFLKSFNVGGFNLIPHITAGIDGSAKDENYHSMASAWLFNQCLKEREQLGLIDSNGKQNLRKKIKRIAEKVYEHEESLCKRIFEKGNIRTITEEEILDFIKDRINMVLSYLNIKALYEKETGVVTEWFYSQLNSFKYSDFFQSQQLQYVRSWKKHDLKFNMEFVK